MQVSPAPPAHVPGAAPEGGPFPRAPVAALRAASEAPVDGGLARDWEGHTGTTPHPTLFVSMQVVFVCRRAMLSSAWPTSERDSCWPEYTLRGA